MMNTAHNDGALDMCGVFHARPTRKLSHGSGSRNRCVIGNQRCYRGSILRAILTCIPDAAGSAVHMQATSGTVNAACSNLEGKKQMSLENDALTVFSLRSFIRAGNGGKWKRRTIAAIRRNFAGATADHIHDLVVSSGSGLKLVVGPRTGKLYVESAS